MPFYDKVEFLPGFRVPVPKQGKNSTLP